jgi:S-adenosylmethionine:tRNA ribosyltransferase-isomerase
VAWFALTQSRSALSDGEVIDIADGRLMAEVEETSENGTRLLRFKCAPESFPRLLEECGETPLPPYIRRAPSPEDAQRYQTVYAQEEGAVAAPTAGLHFSPQMLETLREKRVRLAVLTLHVGLGTFRPVKAENVEDHQMHSERFHLPEECAQAVNEARRDGKRIVAVGTTVVRVLEACADDEGRVTAQTGRTSLFVYPGHRFKVVDALLTNFHLPQSTLLMLVCAFAGTDFVLRAYRQAVAARYRFYSYGDCMLLLP